MIDAGLVLELAIVAAKSEVRKHGDKAHSSVERAFTIPERTFSRLAAGMSPEDKEQARELALRAADSMSDALVFLVSRGTIDPDE